jgi:LysM repeat protein
MAFANALTIEEIDGPARRLVLRGPGLPHQGVSWKSGLQLTTEWYPGGIEATQQVLGPRDLPSDWEGFWRYTMLIRCPCVYRSNGAVFSVAKPVELRDICDAMFRDGRKLRVTWVAADGEGRTHQTLREGRCSEWEFPTDRLEDIGWKFSWVWTGRGAQRQKAVALREDPFLTAYTTMFASITLFSRMWAQDRIRQWKASIPKSASYLTLGQLERLATAPQAIMSAFARTVQVNLNSIKRVVDVADKFRRMPFNVANSLVNTARNTMYMTNQTMDAFSREPPEAQVMTDNLSDMTRSASYFGRTYNAQRDISRQACELARAARVQSATLGARGEAIDPKVSGATISQSVMRVHIVRAGDTPFSVSQKYYGNSDNALTILKANRLSATLMRLPVGRPLIVPVLTNTDLVANG